VPPLAVASFSDVKPQDRYDQTKSRSTRKTSLLGKSATRDTSRIIGGRTIDIAENKKCVWGLKGSFRVSEDCPRPRRFSTAAGANTIDCRGCSIDDSI